MQDYFLSPHKKRGTLLIFGHILSQDDRIVYEGNDGRLFWIKYNHSRGKAKRIGISPILFIITSIINIEGFLYTYFFFNP